MSQPLLAPAQGVPPLVVDEQSLSRVIEELARGRGPIAIDAERASGYRYSQRAYLIQINRRSGGLHLIDPVAVGQTLLWEKMSELFADCEWIIHASMQDLPCLREIGLEPKILFDTELGARIAGCERVGLGALTESLLERTLAKEHSAVDWSIRPLKDAWLNYAALDVELLIELRDEIEKLLFAAGKLAWAQEDFAQILNNPPPQPRMNPWRRTSGMHKVRDRMTLAIIKELWAARDEYAREIDLSPGRVFNDEVLLEIATKRPVTLDAFNKILTRRTKVENPPVLEWFEVLRSTLELSLDFLPELRVSTQEIPPAKLWKERNFLAFARLTHARAAVMARASELNMPPENLISPEPLRKLLWHNPPANLESRHSYVEDKLRAALVRPWQIALLSEVLVEALDQREPLISEVALIPENSENESN